MRWTFLTGGAIISSPAIGADGVVYFSSVDGNLYAVNPDGTERWHYHTGSATESSPVLDARGRRLHRRRKGHGVFYPDGREWWQCGLALPMDVSAAAVAGRFYFSVPWRTVAAVVPGELPWERRLWEADLQDNASTSLTVSPEGILYVCAGFQLYAIRPPGELLPPDKSPWPMFRANPRHTGRTGN